MFPVEDRLAIFIVNTFHDCRSNLSYQPACGRICILTMESSTCDVATLRWDVCYFVVASLVGRNVCSPSSLLPLDVWKVWLSDRCVTSQVCVNVRFVDVCLMKVPILLDCYSRRVQEESPFAFAVRLSCPGRRWCRPFEVDEQCLMWWLPRAMFDGGWLRAR